MRSRPLLSMGAGVVVLWVLVLAAMHVLHAMVPTADSVEAWAHRQNLDGLSDAERNRRVVALADQMNQLSFAERQKLSGRRGLQPLMSQMTEEERGDLMDRTMAKGFAQVMDYLNKMKPEERQKLVSRALENMKQWNPQQQGRPPGMNEAAMQKVAQTGFTSYLQNSSAATKMDLAPLIEQIQMSMQGLGNPAP